MAEEKGSGDRVAGERAEDLGDRPPFDIIGYWRQVIVIGERDTVFMPIKMGKEA